MEEEKRRKLLIRLVEEGFLVADRPGCEEQQCQLCGICPAKRAQKEQDPLKLRYRWTEKGTPSIKR